MILNVKNLSKTYQQGSSAIPVLKDLNLEVEKGDSISVVGASGSGKSTFLSLIAGLDHPSSGKMILNETSVFDLDEDTLASFRSKNIGIVFQQFHLLPHLSALENVMLPLEIIQDSDIEIKAKTALKKVGLESRANHTPDQLSGGEQQRVAIARALVTEPEVLLADEPSGNLDPSTGGDVMDLLFELSNSQKQTLILVTHDHELAKRCKKQFELIDGALSPL